MGILKNKIDFVALISVEMANPNGDPLDGNRPRADYNGYGEMSDVCIKRKIRNRMQDLGYKIFVQSEDRRDEGDMYQSLKERADREIGRLRDGKLKKAEEKKNEQDGLTREQYAARACELYMDVRAFGQLFAYKEKKNKKQDSDKQDTDKVSVGVRGPVSIHQAVSLAPIDVVSIQITRSVNGSPDDKKGRDTMGMRHFVRFGIYKIKGSVNVQLAQKTGFTEQDATVLKECLRTLFVNDASSARPDGSMCVLKLYWWQHNCPTGQYPSAKVHRSISVDTKRLEGLDNDLGKLSDCITVEPLDGLSPEIIDGI